MKRKLKAVASEALELDARSRAALAKQLLESLDDLSDEENERLWAEEAERRLAEFKKGNIKAANGPQVLARARSRQR
jgi:hypothetical protein